MTEPVTRPTPVLGRVINDWTDNEREAFLRGWRQGQAALAAENQKLREALERIQEWDCLNPPDLTLCADHPWLKRLVDEALNPAFAAPLLEGEGASK